MTKKEFKEVMLRGLGRCVIAVRKDPEKYRDIVLWACKRNIAYDAQSEGTRSWYAYTLANAYPDKKPFIMAAKEALRKYRSNGGWDLLHLSELLMFFAMDGYELAGQALEEKYQEMLASMFARKRRPNRIFHELSDLEQLGLVLTVDRTSFLRIAKDFGRLYREKSYMEDGEFIWFFESMGGKYRRSIESVAKRDADVACFLQREWAYVDAIDERREAREAKLSEKMEGVRLSTWLSQKADVETVKEYVFAYREQTEPKLRAKALTAFSHCAYPDDPQPVIQDTYADCEKLQNAAWRALENIRHPAVRQFALNNAHKGIHTSENYAVLITNYAPEDGKMMKELLWQMIANKDWEGVHSAGRDVYRAFRKDSSIPRPKHLLPLLYEYNPCSNCRESALRYMSKHRMLTKDMLEECLYDSNEDIRRMAEKKLR